MTTSPLLTDVLTAPAVDPLSTPFEEWCVVNRVHPEHPGAWDLYRRVCDRR